MKAFLFSGMMILVTLAANAQSGTGTLNIVKNPGLDRRAEFWEVTSRATIDSSSVTLEGANSYIQQLAAISPYVPLQIAANVSLSATLDGKADCPTATFIVGSWDPNTQ